MVRNVVVVKMREGYDIAWLDGLFERFQALNCPGTVAYTIGADIGLREANWTFAIVADFVDAKAYQDYDTDPAHNALRQELAVYADQTARAQFEL